MQAFDGRIADGSLVLAGTALFRRHAHLHTRRRSQTPRTFRGPDSPYKRGMHYLGQLPDLPSAAHRWPAPAHPAQAARSDRPLPGLLLRPDRSRPAGRAARLAQADLEKPKNSTRSFSSPSPAVSAPAICPTSAASARRRSRPGTAGSPRRKITPSCSTGRAAAGNAGELQPLPVGTGTSALRALAW